jgi:hypothetical protein
LLEVIEVFERPSSRRLQFDRLMEGAIGDAPGQCQGLDGMKRRPCQVGLSCALVESDHQVVRIVFGRPKLLPWQVTYLECEQSVWCDSAEDARDPILLGFIKMQFHTYLGSGMAVDGQMGAAELPFVGQVGKHAEVGASVRRVDKTEAVATL